MKVFLANYTVDAIEEIYRAYKLCYASGTQMDIKLPRREVAPSIDGKNVMSCIDYEAMAEFIKPLMAAGHTSPLEHVSFTFYIMGVSRSLTHQLVRHRTGSYNQQSQRYVKLAQFEYIIPPSIERNEKAKKLFLEAMEDDQRKYDEIVELLVEDYVEMNCGVKVPYSEIKADVEYNGILLTKQKLSKFKKMAIEDARYVFPNACCSNITMTIDGNNIRNFFAQRQCKNAQWEIRELANEMCKYAKAIVPFIDYKCRWCGVICNECKGE